MIGLIGDNNIRIINSSLVNPSTTPGVSVTPGTTGKGSWASLVTSVSQNAVGLILWVFAGNTSAGQRDIIIDIGIDPAGGTSYQVLVPDILAHQASNAVDTGRWYWFPMRIPAGAQVAARGYSNSTTAFRAAVIILGAAKPEAIRSGSYAVSIGLGSGVPRGTSITPGNSAAEGSWTSLGTAPAHLWHLQPCVGFSGTTTTSQMYYIDVAVGDGTNYNIIVENFPLFHPGTAERTGHPLLSPLMGYCSVPTGATIYMRASASGTADANMNGLVIGIGG